MFVGILAGLATGALWGLTFVAPRAVEPFTALDIAASRYAIFGVASALLMLHPKFRPHRLGRRRFGVALILGLSGYVVYFVGVAYAVRLAGPAIPPLIIGTLPVLLAIIGNWHERSVPWRALAIPLVLIGAGVGAVNVNALARADGPSGQGEVLAGLGLSILALGVWLHYAIVNAREMRSDDPPRTLPWTGLQGIGAALGTLFLIPPMMMEGGSGLGHIPIFSAAGWTFIVWSVVLGLLASWVATWLWAVASHRLPLALSAQLIVAETVFALIYGFMFEKRWPDPAEWAGAGLLVSGVTVAVGVFSRPRAA